MLVPTEAAGVRSPGAEVTVFNHQLWVLESRLGFSVRAVHILNSWAVLPVLAPLPHSSVLRALRSVYLLLNIHLHHHIVTWVCTLLPSLLSHFLKNIGRRGGVCWWWRCLQRPEVLDLDLKLKAVVNWRMWLLGCRLEFSGRSWLNH